MEVLSAHLLVFYSGPTSAAASLAPEILKKSDTHDWKGPFLNNITVTFTLHGSLETANHR